ncbi:MAG: arsenite efflux transporter metallochaperone ArsD [Fimbriimonadaceae bacterium]|jgi:hypothetical protein|nr:arsenite efflux transporter metallochaperone ArsD [Fimbriimonadaceae bacterium]
MMKTLQVFDPAMCCSTGVCGPSVDQKLVKLAADLAFLKSQGVTVERFNLGYQPEAFTTNQIVMDEMGAEAEHLPIFLVDGELMAKATYPSRAEFAGWFGLEVGVSTDKPRIELKIATTKCCRSGTEGCC